MVIVSMSYTYSLYYVIMFHCTSLDFNKTSHMAVSAGNGMAFFTREALLRSVLSAVGLDEYRPPPNMPTSVRKWFNSARKVDKTTFHHKVVAKSSISPIPFHKNGTVVPSKVGKNYLHSNGLVASGGYTASEVTEDLNLLKRLRTLNPDQLTDLVMSLTSKQKRNLRNRLILVKDYLRRHRNNLVDGGTILLSAANKIKNAPSSINRINDKARKSPGLSYSLSDVKTKNEFLHQQPRSYVKHHPTNRLMPLHKYPSNLMRQSPLKYVGILDSSTSFVCLRLCMHVIRSIRS